MKGFPNQVSDLKTLACALKVMIDLDLEGKNPKDDGVFGEALIRRGVLRTRHRGGPVEEYLAEQRKKRTSHQSFRTRARALRELFRVLSLINDYHEEVEMLPRGRQIASLAGEEMTSEAQRLWRSVILHMSHDGGDGTASHPYQLLLRLVARRPGITRAKCALALEAKDDSEEELNRIVGLAAEEEDRIREIIAVTQSTWDNAKKILPSFAEQLGDVQKVGDKFYLSDAPGSQEAPRVEPETGKEARGARRPKGASSVTADSIAKAGTEESYDEVDELLEPEIDPQKLRAAKAKTKKRLKRHNLLVQQLAKELEAEGAELFERPFDCLACFDDEGLLVEVKTLDGTKRDQVSRVREALAQLLYYESFVTKPLVKKRAVRKVACFEAKVCDAHIDWLQASDIFVIWVTDDGFDGTLEAKDELCGHFEF